LDAVAPSRPVWLTRVDGHAGWANSEAMRRGHVDRETKAPSDGQILKDKEGIPTGVFIDGAMNLVGGKIPAPSQADFARQILAGQTLLLKEGLTGVHDAGVSSLEAEAYRQLDREGRLKLRVYGMASGSEGALKRVSHRPIPAKPTSRFELRAIKLFIDGAMGSRGGLLFEPYSDDPGNKGLLLIEPKDLEAITVEALKHGWQVATHAIGDRGNALVLDAYEAALKAVPEAKSPRLRIEHAQVVRRVDLERFARLGVIASMQPSHAIDDMRWADARLGPGRVDGAYAWRWFLDNQISVAFGSDFPVEIVNPFYGIYAGLAREDESGNPAGGWHPDQKLSIEETLRGFTSGAAYAAFEEDRLGILKPGMRADLTIVDRDLFKAKPIEVLKARVVMTVLDGEIVYETSDR
ncbi:amidohydrolase, partial [Singulisphaera rosea]